MALRSSATYFRTMLGRLSGNTHVKTNGHDLATANNTGSRIRAAIKGDFLPVYVSLGLIMTSVSFGVHTVVQQLCRCPNVSVNKKRREMVSEVVEPERVVGETQRFIDGSFFRKVAHVQDSNLQDVMPDPIHQDVFAWRREPKAVTLKDVGVDPLKAPGSPPVHPAAEAEEKSS